MQERVGVRERMEQVGPRFIRDFMPDQHQELFAKLPWLVVGSLDRLGRPRSSVLAGPPGFLSAPDPRTLRVDALPGPGDPLGEALAVGAPVGLLGIELATRRRNRVNGRVVAIDARGFAVRVEQSFGNCKQYIQARRVVGAGAALAFSGDPSDLSASTASADPADLSTRSIAARIARADTFFIATASAAAAARTGDPAEGVDVSHRGGKPGFVRAAVDPEGRTVLTWPDFPGNMVFNTLGNLAIDPRAGLLFVDFERGDLLDLVGRAEVAWEGRELDAFAGAERLVRFTVDEARVRPGALPLRWSDPAPAPQLAATGSWDEVARALADDQTLEV